MEKKEDKDESKSDFKDLIASLLVIVRKNRGFAGCNLDTAF